MVLISRPEVKSRLSVVEKRIQPFRTDLTKVIRPSADEIEDYRRFTELGLKLHQPAMKTMWRMKNIAPDGEVLHDYEWFAKSWVRNGYNMLLSQMAAVDGDGSSFTGGQISVTNTLGSHRTGARPIGVGGSEATIDWITVESDITVNDQETGAKAAAGEDDIGIVVGGGSTAESFEDTVLVTPRAEGTGTDQFNHAAQTAKSIDFTTLVLTVTHQRFLNNNSGAGVDVEEVGLIYRVFTGQSSSSAENILVVRDVTGTVTVPDTGQLDVSFDIALTYPS